MTHLSPDQFYDVVCEVIDRLKTDAWSDSGPSDTDTYVSDITKAAARLRMSRARETALHVRDPDGGCDLRLFDGNVEVDPAEFDVIDVDAGRGYTAEDWAESTAWAETLPAGELRDAVAAAYGDPPGGKYIDDGDEVAR